MYTIDVIIKHESFSAHLNEKELINLDETFERLGMNNYNQYNEMMKKIRVQPLKRYNILIVLLIHISNVYSQSDYYMSVFTHNHSILYDITEVDSICFYKDNNSSTNILPGFISKSLILHGQKVAFFGDSIIKGNVNSDIVTDYDIAYWLNLIFDFSDYDNFAVGGARLCKGSSKYTSVPEQIKNEDISTYSVIFIGAGVNDWFGGTTLEDFGQSLSDILSYLHKNAQPLCNIIFITPISCVLDYYSFYKREPVHSLLEYSNEITRRIRSSSISDRCSVIRGDSFGFPNCGDSQDFIELMFGDKVHPTELGYRTLFLTGILKALYHKE